MSRGVQIVGAGESRHGHVPGTTADELSVEAALAALDDAGLSPRDVDGLFSSSAYHFMPTLTLGEHLGITPRHTDASSIGGASFVSHMGHAKAALEAGLCDTALIAYGSTQRSDGGALVSASEPPPLEAPLGLRYPVSGYALAAARHAHLYGTTPEQLAQVAVSARDWARRNPDAFARDPLTIDDVAASPMVSTPLRKADCCLVTDGGAAFVMVRADRAADLDARGITVAAVAEAHEHRHIGQMPELTETAARHSGPDAFARAGIGPADIDLAMLYDAFTINVPLFLEDLGFCKKGEGGPFVADGAIGPGGALPVNPNGGGLSYTHPGMLGAFLVTEAVRQLRGTARGAQVDRARTAVVHGNGGVLSSQVTAVLTA
ncbi:acetyl-CoA acetyltransferase [Nocardiopsis coralliicola]